MQAVVSDLRATIVRELEPLAPGDEKFVLLDFPDHHNVGDSAIWLGDCQYFEAVVGRRPEYVSKLNFNDDDAVDRVGGPIYLHGGGNFGDIYPMYQDFREEIVRRYPARRIVQLPQTIHFASAERLDESRRIISRHKDFTLCVRDRPSYEIAKTFDCQVRLVPDMAFMLDLERTAPPTLPGVFLRRSDLESAASFPAPDGWADVDWPLDPSDLRPRAKVKAVLGSAASPKHVRYAYFKALAQARLSRGLAILSQGEQILTDRLHAHILATLMGVPHRVLDNSYGKLSGFMDAWETDRPGAPGERVTKASVVGSSRREEPATM